MKIIILIDQKTGRVVRAYSEHQLRFMSAQSPNEFPNCEKHIVQANKDTLICGRHTTTIVNKIIDELKQWEGLSEEIETFEQEDLESLTNILEDLIGKHLIRRPSSKKAFVKPNNKDFANNE